MKFIVDVADFYIEEGDLSKILIAEVTHDVVQQIKEQIKGRVHDVLAEKIGVLIRESLANQIDDHVKEIIETGTVTVNSRSVKMVDYIKDRFINNHSYNTSVENFMKAQAEKFAADMKNRYDLLFASQLVSKMNGIGLLKEDVAKLLLPEVKPQ